MIVLNFSHPLAKEHLEQIAELIGQPINRVIQISSQTDPQKPLIPQVVTMVDQVGFSAETWQGGQFLVNPPSLNYIAVALLAEIHGRCGHFPTCVRLRPRLNSMPTRFEVAEVINLQWVRDEARQRHHQSPLTGSDL